MSVVTPSGYDLGSERRTYCIRNSGVCLGGARTCNAGSSISDQAPGCRPWQRMGVSRWRSKCSLGTAEVHHSWRPSCDLPRDKNLICDVGCVGWNERSRSSVYITCSVISPTGACVLIPKDILWVLAGRAWRCLDSQIVMGQAVDNLEQHARPMNKECGLGIPHAIAHP